jgi:hypothetical protein
MAGAVLQHVGERAGRVASLGQPGVVMNRDEHDSSVETSGNERSRDGDAVKARHHDVRDDDVRMGLVRGPEKGTAVSNRGDDIELHLEQLSQLFGDPRVIFG